MAIKRKNTIIIVLISLLSVSLVWSLIFWLPDIGAEVAQAIHGNPVTNAPTSAYYDFFTSLLCAVFSFFNLLFAALDLFEMHVKRRTGETIGKLTVYWVWTLVSLGALGVHCLSFHWIFQAYAAG